MERRRNIRDILYTVLILLLVLAVLCCVAQLLHYYLSGEEITQQIPSKTITKNGVDYFPRQDITVIMVVGIDQYGKVTPSGSYNNHGAADMVLLMIFDDINKTYDILYLNRDTMMTIPVLGIGGKPAGTTYGQLALSHTYGTGLEDSCENTRNAVSGFLSDIRIDYYVAMNMDVVSILTDAVDGVTVNVTEDFSSIDPSIPMGLVTLNGEQALNYVRTRKGVGDQLNLSRIERQQEFVDSFMKAFAAKRSEGTQFFASTYESISEYLVTDCSGTTVDGLYDRYSNFELHEIYTPEGENVAGEKYMEFYADEEKLEDLTLQLFYAPKK